MTPGASSTATGSVSIASCGPLTSLIRRRRGPTPMLSSKPTLRGYPTTSATSSSLATPRTSTASDRRHRRRRSCAGRLEGRRDGSSATKGERDRSALGLVDETLALLGGEVAGNGGPSHHER